MRYVFTDSCKKFLNISSYEWLLIYRQVFAYGGVVLLFAWYLSPLIKETKNKNLCVKTISSIFLQREDFKRDVTNLPELSVKDLALSSAYMACTNNSFQ